MVWVFSEVVSAGLGEGWYLNLLLTKLNEVSGFFSGCPYLCAASNDGNIADKHLLKEVDLLKAFILVLEIEANFLCSVLHLNCC